MKIEVKTYEESRLEFFKDLARKAEKKLDKCIRAMKQSDYDNPLSENHIALDDALEIKSFYSDIVCMLYTDKPNKWISVEEQAPKNNDEVIVCRYNSKLNFSSVGIDQYNGYGEWNKLERDFDTNVWRITHWMPLPDAPKERAEE